MILLADSKGPDQIARLRSLIWVFSVRICPEGTFTRGAAQMLNFQDDYLRKKDIVLYDTALMFVYPFYP